MAKVVPSRSPKSAPYSRPKEAGGKLIREVIQLLRKHKIALPISSHNLIATSGGADSTALATLIAKYGRRVVPDPRQITLLHVNHGWRGAESDADEEFVRELARKLGVRFRSARLKGGVPQAGMSWEDEGRKGRKSEFEKIAAKSHAVVLTAHHADDLAETLLWRLLTGAAGTHGGGIAVQHDREVRPFLRVRKSLLYAFLKEEGQSWREDRTNHEGRFLRSRLRQELMPQLETLFPRAVEHLVELGLQAQERTQKGPEREGAFQTLFGAAGLAARRAHWNSLNEVAALGRTWKGELTLPQGWRLQGERKIRRERGVRQCAERWILERDKPLE